MSVLRQQFTRKVVVNTLASPSVNVVNIFGPTSPLETPYAENTDHVIRERQNRQNEAGFVVIDGFEGSALATDNLTVDIEIWRRASASAQKGLETALFPSGAAAPADPQLSRVVATGLLGAADSAQVQSLLGGSLGGVDSKDVPALHLRAGEFVLLRLTATAGGTIGPVTLAAKYDLGGNPGDTHRLA